MGVPVKYISSFGISVLLCIIALSLNAQSITVSTHAGTGIEGFVDGDALTQAQFSFPIGVGTCVGNDGAVYVADRGNHAVRKVFNGQVTTLAGNGTQGYADGVGSAAQFAFPNAITVDDTNNVYVADWQNAVIRKITPAGVVTTYVGTPGVTGYQDGPGSSALFFAPFGLTIDASGNIYVAEANNLIRKIAPDRTVTTYAGQYVFGQGGYLDGPATTARFDRPSGLAFDNAGNLYVTEESNHTIRKISASLIVTTIAGINHIGAGPGAGGYIDGDGLTQAEFNTPSGVAVTSDGNIYVADENNHRIRKITPAGIVSTFAGSGPVGSGNGGFAEGPADSARFNLPYSICHDSNNNFYIADLNNHRIRKISVTPPLCNLQTSFVVTDESCAGAEDGVIDLTVTNGTLPFTFSWSNGQTTEDISNLPVGGYFVIVTDSNNCTASETTVVNTTPPDSATAANTPPSCSELFISEYEEGTGQNKALEIYNPTSDTILLNRYIVMVFMNGAPTPLLSQLIGFLPPHKTHVIAHPNASSAIQSKAQQTSQKLNFDGDDALQLIKIKNDISISIDSIEGIGQNPHTLLDSLDIDTIDQLGIPYVDPGNQGFPAGTGTTKNSTLIRNASVTSGITNWGCGQKQWKTMPQNDNNDLGKHYNLCALDTTAIYFEIANATHFVDSIGKDYLIFEILAGDNNDSIWFDRTQIFLKFDTLAFGNDPYWEITKGPAFDDSTYIDVMNYSLFYNYTPGRVKFFIFTNPFTTSWNRVNIPSSPILLFHIKVEIQCNQNAGIEYDSLNSGNISYFKYNPTQVTGAIYPYTYQIFKNDFNAVLCQKGIWQFSPNPISAGVGSVLTIDGFEFGATRGNGRVIFKNADDWGATYIRLDSIDYLSWSDNEIQINFPADVAVTGSVINIPGNGYFYVITDAGDSLKSNDSLIISYARHTLPLPDGFSEPYDKLKVHLGTTRLSDSSTFVFNIDTSIANNPMIFAIVKKAMRDWGCATGVNFTVGSIVQNQVLNYDTTSIIFLNSNSHGNPVAGTVRAKRVCGTNYLNSDADIFLSRDLSGIPGNPQWNYDTTTSSIPPNSQDFYEVILHELGHAHGLEHVLNVQEVMYTGHLPGPIPVIGRISIKSDQAPYDSPNSREGAKEVITESESIIIDTTCLGFEGTLVHYLCKGPSQSIKWYDPSGFAINVSPNPNIDNTLFITYSLNGNSHIALKLIDVLGREVVNIYDGETKPGKYKHSVDLSNLNPGIYLLITNINEKRYSLKIIKL